MDRKSRLLRAVRSSGLRREQIAEEIGISYSRFTQLLNGDEFKESQFKAFCEITGADPSFILWGDDSEEKLISKIEKLPPGAQQFIRDMIFKIGQIWPRG